MTAFLAALPILIVLGLMIGPRWGGERAGPAGWLAGVAIASVAFGLNGEVLWVSQLRGLFLSAFVLAVLWPALYLYNVVDRVGGIAAMAHGLESSVTDRGTLLVIVAWAFSGMLEGLAGFGLPIAIVAPMLVVLGVSPVRAVAAVAVGHAWSVTFGDMGIIYQTLTSLVGMDPQLLAPMASLMLGVACLACGLGAALLLKQGRRWPVVLVVAGVISAVQYALAISALRPLTAFGAGLAGVLVAIPLGRFFRGGARAAGAGPVATPALRSALVSYAGLALVVALIALVPPVRAALGSAVWQMSFPEVTSRTGFITPAGPGTAFHPFTHPGIALLLVGALSPWVYRVGRGTLARAAPGDARRALLATWRSAWPATVGIISMVGLSTMMDHTGMTLRLAHLLGAAMGGAYPLVSPLIGILGAFATGSNNNSNVLFAGLQQNAAALLGIDPRVLLAAQTTGGALGSMIAPAKIIVGCATVRLTQADGAVLRRTLPYGLGIGLMIGLLAWMLA